MRRVSISLLFTVCFQCAFATVFHVSTSGNDGSGDGSAGNPWRTLRTAVTKVVGGQGHSIQLSAGTFVESGPFNVPAGVSIEGAGIDKTIIKAASSFYFNPASPGFAIDKFLMTLTSSSPSNGNQSLKNFTLDGDGKRLHGGIFVKFRSHVLLENIKVQGTNFCGIWIWDVKDSALRRVTLVNCSWGDTGWASGALQLANLERVELEGLNIDESTGYGIKALGSGGNKISNMKVFDSRISVNPAGKWNNGSAPNISFELWEVYLVNCEIYNNYLDNHLSLVNFQTPPTGGRSVRVHHNVFDLLSRAKGNGYSIELSINDAEIDHNWFNGGSYGIAHWSPAYCTNWKIHHNTFTALSNGYPGDAVRAQVSGVHNLKFYNNTVELSGTRTINVIGLHAGKSDNLDIKNNLIINSNTSYAWFPNQLIFMEGGATLSGLQVVHNLLDGLPLGNVSGTYTNNLLVTSQIAKTGAKPSSYYLPSAGSPLVDGGINVGFPFLGSAPDIGANEFASSAIAPPNKLPAVNLTSPANNSNFESGSSITLTANATDQDGSVNKVEFYNGSTKLGEDTSSPFSFSWTNVAVGSYSLTAKAIDNQGGSTTSTAIKTTVNSPNELPAVTITAPATNSSFKAGSNITITANASDSDGTLSKTEFFNGTVKLGEALVSPYNFTWNNVPVGVHTITAKATDNRGGSTTSSAIKITITAANTLPSIAITAPGNNSDFTTGSSVAITAIASDSDGTVSKTEFFNGTAKLGEDLVSPYNLTWNNIPAGVHDITAKATDNQGGTSMSAVVTINVKDALSKPIVYITSPTTNETFTSGSSIEITANASASQKPIDKVEFYNGDKKLGEDLTKPYSLTLNNAPSGSYSLTAKAIDNQGMTGISPIIAISVVNTNKPPVVSLTVPSSNAQFSAGGNLTLNAKASDIDGSIAKVEFFQGNTKLGEDLTSPYTFIWNKVFSGTYSFSAKATDNEGKMTTSNSVNIVVNSPASPPVVKLTAPLQNSTFSSGVDVLLAATASSGTGSIKKVEFFNGNKRLGEDFSSPYSFIWNEVPPGNYTLSAKATDNQGSVGSSVEVNISVSSPANNPTVTITSPENNSSLNDSSIVILADALDTDGTVTKVEFYNGKDKLGEDNSSPYAYHWNNVQEGTYLISVKAVDNEGLTQEDQIQIVVQASPTANAGDDITLSMPMNSVSLEGSGVSSNGSMLLYSWSQVSGPNDVSFTDASTDRPVLSNLEEGTYTIELTVTDDRGLLGKDQVMIIVNQSEIALKNIPRYFSPNDDGINDFWEWPDVNLYANSMLTIFNREGQKIYETESYQNSWDGKIAGRPLQEDSYFYIIQLRGHAIKGAVQIIR